MVNLTLDSLEAVPGRCRSCVFWELSPLCAESDEVGDPGLEKEAWVSQTLLEWGGCGRIAYEGERVAGFITYASPKFVPRSVEFPSGPVSPDAALLMTAYVKPSYSGTGLGRQLVQTAAADVARRGIYALEAFGDSRAESNACLVPADFYRSVGFKTVRADPRYPRLRLELRPAVGRRPEAGASMELPEPVEWFELDDSELEQFFDEPSIVRPRSDRPGVRRAGG
ncbi:MAG TPA: GNAT family N-acetyltransferase [Glycomyces sp.]|nr:GNAT family N-acetyltransferase [Glycomyces sp.]